VKYNDRIDIERIGVTGSYYYNISDNIISARILSSFWLVMEDSNDEFVPHLKKDGFWESWVSLWISQNVSPGSICIDGGANYGYYTFQLLLHGCEVYSIEANPFLIPFLEKSLKLNGKLPLTIINSAITDGTTDKIVLNITKSPLHSSVLNFKTSESQVEVNTISLQSFKGKKIDFIKLDIEGCEQQVLPDLFLLQNENPNMVCLIEWVYDSYPNKSRQFYEYLINHFYVTYIDFDGKEKNLESYEFIENETLDLRMYVLRKK
jgi:FkbM family methyltransferase